MGARPLFFLFFVGSFYYFMVAMHGNFSDCLRFIGFVVYKWAYKKCRWSVGETHIFFFLSRGAVKLAIRRKDKGSSRWESEIESWCTWQNTSGSALVGIAVHFLFALNWHSKVVTVSRVWYYLHTTLLGSLIFRCLCIRGWAQETFLLYRSWILLGWWFLYRFRLPSDRSYY